MRPDRCGDCGDEFVWDSEAGSAVCPSCGTLQDSSQVVLDSHIEPEENARERDAFAFYHRTTLKTFRGAHGWDLAGQGSQPAAERNKIAMREFIAALARGIGHPSLASRTLFLFELAVERGHFRHGRKANLVAGASLVITLRENQKGETIKDIAYLLNESHVALARAFRTVASLLDVKPVAVDPSWHLPTLQKHLANLLRGNLTALPSNLGKVLKGVHLPSAFQIAVSLSELVSRAGIAINLPSPPTACAIYILALEAEALSALPHCGELAKALGRRFDTNGEVVMRRYRMIYDRIEGWAGDIPWLSDLKNHTSSKSAAKVAKRVGIARCLKDVVQYQESLWKAKLEATGSLTMPGGNDESVSLSELRVPGKVDIKRNGEASKLSRPRKRQKTRPINDVPRFLLSPLWAGSAEKPHINRVAPLETASHMLTSDVPSLNQRPSRLQLLAVAKPADSITDEELFGEGELESFLRTAEEREALIRTCDWAQEENRESAADRRKTHAGHTGKSRPERDSASERNVKASVRLLDERDLTNWNQNSDKDDDDDSWALGSPAHQIMTQTQGFEDEKSETSLEACDDSQQAASSIGDDEEEILGPWRPLSPDNADNG